MRILITSGLGEKDIGGPFQYASGLKDAFQNMGHEVKVVSYGSLERILPVGLRHLYFFLKVLPRVAVSDKVLTLDTFSVGLPTLWASRIFGKLIIARVGGDYLWSAYVNRTNARLTLVEFYRAMPKLNLKEKIIKRLTKYFVKKTDFLAFNTEWQKNIWRDVYVLSPERAGVVRNFVPPLREEGERDGEKKIFLWAGRKIPEKNLDFLERVGQKVGASHQDFELRVLSGLSHQEVFDEIKKSYIIVSPALTDICPNFILEGISLKKPFIMTQETGLDEMFPRAGTFASPLDEESWVKAFEQMLDEKIYNNYQEALVIEFKERSWAKLTEEYIAIWKKI